MFGRSWWGLALVVMVALMVRAGFLISDPHPFPYSGLAADSAEIARQIDQHGRWFQSNLTALNELGDLQDAQQRLIDPAALNFRVRDQHPRYQEEALEPPGEPLVLAALWKLTGSERWLPYQLLMIVVDSLMTLVVFYIGVQLFGRRRTALAASLLYAVFPPIGWLTTVPHLDIWGVDLTLAVTALLLRARASGWSVHRLLSVGLVLGLGCYFRPELLLLPPLIALATLERRRWHGALRAALIPLVVAAALLVPWTIRNAVVFHRFIPVRIGIGQNLWEGMGEMRNNFGAKLDDYATYEQVHAVRPDLVYGTPAYDSLLESWAIGAIKHYPMFYAKLVGKRLLDATVLLQNRDWSQNVVSALLEPLLLGLSLLTVLFTRRRFGRSHLILLAVIVATIAPYLFLHFEPRYVLPASFAYLLWTALGAGIVAEWVRVRAGRPVPGVQNARDSRELVGSRRE